MCLSVFPRDISKTDAARISRHTMSRGNPLIFLSKGYKAQKNKSVSVCRWNTMLPFAAYVSYAGFSPLQCPAAQAMLATPGFALHHFPAADAAAQRRFFRAWSFSQSASTKQTLPAWVMALL